MASQSRFFTKLIRGRRFRSFLVAAAMNGTPSTRWSFRRNSGVSSSVSVAFSTVATTLFIISCCHCWGLHVRCCFSLQLYAGVHAADPYFLFN